MKKTITPLLLGILVSGALSAQLNTSHDALFMPDVAQPAVGNSVNDPVFGTQIRRLTNAQASGNLGTVPHYSKRQAWNANDSLMLLYNADDGYFDLYNGQTYQFIRPLLDPVIGGEDVFWHPVKKTIILYSADNVLYEYNVATGELVSLRTFPGYTWVNTRGEGNLSNDGRYYAFIGQVYNEQTEETFFKDVIVYDIEENQVVSTMEVSHAESSGFIDWMSISPQGNYVVIDYSDEETGRYHGVEIYDRDMNFLWQYPAGAGHSDLGYDSNGEQILVKDFYDSGTNTKFIKKYRLSDGAVTDLLEVSMEFDMHISLRNTGRTGWCYVSTFDDVGRLTDDEAGWLPFEDEVFALKTDGGGDVERICHHHSRRFSPQTPDPDNSVYWAEPHATVNRAGTKVIWGSNWRKNMNQVTAVDVYLCDISGYVGINESESSYSGKNNLLIYPNPASDHLNIKLDLKRYEDIQILITDLAGRKIRAWRYFLTPGQNLPDIGISDLRSGVYLISVQSGSSILNEQFVKTGG